MLQMLANVQQKTIQPVIEATVAQSTLIYTDEYDIYARLEAWGYRGLPPTTPDPNKSHLSTSCTAIRSLGSASGFQIVRITSFIYFSSTCSSLG